jgi:23S rRNA (cytidine1920-2'-O)/16S rRNA (cytidine1409-2'-O)-methyltransferase
MIDVEQLELVNLLVERSLFSDYSEAIFQIRRGRVMVDGSRVYNIAALVDSQATIRVVSSDQRFVSRGGLKLEHAIKSFEIDVDGKVCIDIGASTGGFTDCLLAYGADKIYTVDVGYGILDWELRNHQKVVVLERKNARYLTEKDISEKAEFITIDVNHISAVTIVKNVIPLLDDNGKFIILVKPQFEIPKYMCKEPDFHRGIVTSDSLREHIVQKTIDSLSDLGLTCSAPLESPIQGANGNREFFVLAGNKV